jgi:integrase
MTVYRIKETGLWRYDFYVKGRRYTRKGFTSAAKARSGEHKRREEVTAGLTELFPTFTELVNAWLEAGEATKGARYLTGARQNLNRAFGHLARMRPRDITRGHVEPVLTRLARTRKPATVNAYRRDISAVMNFGVSMGAIPFNPVRAIRTIPDDDHRRPPIPTSALRDLIGASKPRFRALLIFCSQAGCRWVEAARLEWTDIATDEGGRPVAMLTTRKTRRGGVRRRPQPLTPLALEALDLVRGLDAKFVFARKRGGMRLHSADRMQLVRTCKRLKLPVYGWHQIRHWAGYVASRTGKNKRAIAELLGHSDTHSTERYMHATSNELWEMAGALEDALGVDVRGVTKGVTAGEN